MQQLAAKYVLGGGSVRYAADAVSTETILKPPLSLKRSYSQTQIFRPCQFVWDLQAVVILKMNIQIPILLWAFRR